MKNTWITKIANNSSYVIELYDGEDENQNRMIAALDHVKVSRLVFPWIDLSKPHEYYKAIKISANGRFLFYIFQNWNTDSIQTLDKEDFGNNLNHIVNVPGDASIQCSKIFTIKDNLTPHLSRDND